MMRSTLTAAAMAALLAGPSLAAGSHQHGHAAKTGQAGRTVEITMHDNYFEPESVTVKPGEVIRFVVRNEGSLVHEFNIGTPQMHEEHASEMQMMVDHGVLKASSIDMAAAQHMQQSMGHGMHDHPNSVLLEPGQTGEVVWEFPRGGPLEFACNVPGHYRAGMVGDFELQ